MANFAFDRREFPVVELGSLVRRATGDAVHETQTFQILILLLVVISAVAVLAQAA